MKTNARTTARKKSEAPATRLPYIEDYRLAVESRQASLLGRREVLSGKAKFGIFGDGKELAQLAMARAFQPGDWRSGYYRDQTFMFAIGESSVEKFFAQLYAHTDVEAEPSSAGRSMNGHFATRFIDANGNWLDQTIMRNVSADVSPTGSQMPRLVGLAYASRLYRANEALHEMTTFSRKGNEVAFGTIGNASCAEGMFWESVNAIGVLMAPAVISIWDDGFGISVPNELQVTKSNIGELLSGFQRTAGSTSGYDVHVVYGWDYPSLIATYAKASETARAEHVPQIIHVIEVTQPQGHSTSGSHERYKTPERMNWEKEFDCITRFRALIIDKGYATSDELDTIDREAMESARLAQRRAFEAYSIPIRAEITEATTLLHTLAVNLETAGHTDIAADVAVRSNELASIREPFRRDIMVVVHATLRACAHVDDSLHQPLATWYKAYNERIKPLYASHLFCEDDQRSALNVQASAPQYDPNAMSVNGSEVINAFFKAAMRLDKRIVAFGEDAGKLGDVNQGMSGCQTEFGELRVMDTGIRECTILGQAIGMAMRGLRPIAEIQYLDYVLYALQLMADDLATVHWRTKGGQKAPVIVRTRGHRLEGIWHSGSPMAGIINLVRGIHVCVPRNFTQAAGMYATLLKGDDPGLVVEVLNAYRLKERLPSNIGEYTVELGVPEVVRTGSHITLVTYGASVRVALDASAMLEKFGIDVEVVDVQTLLPFDRKHLIVESLKKTNRLMVLDEDVPGGMSSYILRHIIEEQNGYRYLDSAPRTLTAAEHRPAYGTDGNYWSKPEAEHVFDAAYAIMNESDPAKYNLLY